MCTSAAIPSLQCNWWQGPQNVIGIQRPVRKTENATDIQEPGAVDPYDPPQSCTNATTGAHGWLSLLDDPNSGTCESKAFDTFHPIAVANPNFVNDTTTNYVTVSGSVQIAGGTLDFLDPTDNTTAQLGLQPLVHVTYGQLDAIQVLVVFLTSDATQSLKCCLVQSLDTNKIEYDRCSPNIETIEDCNPPDYVTVVNVTTFQVPKSGLIVSNGRIDVNTLQANTLKVIQTNAYQKASVVFVTDSGNVTEISARELAIPDLLPLPQHATSRSGVNMTFGYGSVTSNYMRIESGSFRLIRPAHLLSGTLQVTNKAKVTSQVPNSFTSYVDFLLVNSSIVVQPYCLTSDGEATEYSVALGCVQAMSPAFFGPPALAAYNQPYDHPLVHDPLKYTFETNVRNMANAKLGRFCVPWNFRFQKSARRLSALADSFGVEAGSACTNSMSNSTEADFYTPYGVRADAYYGLDLVKNFKFAVKGLPATPAPDGFGANAAAGSCKARA